MDELKHRLVQVWAELDHRHIAKQLSDSGDAISMRVNTSVEAQGGYFEHVHSIYM